MIQICALASGSNGNCYYIGNSSDAILIDAGISTKQILLRMQQRNLDARKLRAVFVTHEHTDHSRGIRVLSAKLGIPIYLTQGTFIGIREQDRPALVRLIEGDSLTVIGNFNIHSFLKNHDAAEPCSYRVEYKGTSVGVFTDIGEACENVQNNLAVCRALFLEANYDEDMLWNGPYPYYLKKRVASNVGHMSNMQASELLGDHAGGLLEYVFLSHLSKENNTGQKALECFQKHSEQYKIYLTSREEATEVFTLQ